MRTAFGTCRCRSNMVIGRCVAVGSRTTTSIGVTPTPGCTHPHRAHRTPTPPRSSLPQEGHFTPVECTPSEGHARAVRCVLAVRRRGSVHPLALARDVTGRRMLQALLAVHLEEADTLL